MYEVPAWISNHIPTKMPDEITYVYILKIQQLHRGNLGMDKQFYPTFCWTWDHLSIMGI